MKDLLDSINAWYVLLLAVAGGLVTFAVTTRERWAKSRTNALMEAGQQAGTASIIAALTAAQVREKEAWALVTQARVDRDSQSLEMGRMREDIADLKAREENCQRELQAFRNQLETIEITHRDERRRDVNKLANQRHLIGEQARALRDAGLDPNITGILGDLG